jgi:hypothetical protein
MSYMPLVSPPAADSAGSSAAEASLIWLPGLAWTAISMLIFLALSVGYLAVFGAIRAAVAVANAWDVCAAVLYGR